MKKIASILAAAALTAGGLVSLPALLSSPEASSQAFTCVIFLNMSGGYSQADGCRASQYYEVISGTRKWGPYKPRGYKSRLDLCYAGWQRSGYIQTV